MKPATLAAASCFALAFGLASLAIGAEVVEIQKQLDTATVQLSRARTAFSAELAMKAEYVDAKAKFDAAVAELDEAKSRGGDAVQGAAQKKLRAKADLDVVTKKLEAADPDVSKYASEVNHLKDELTQVTIAAKKQAESELQQAATAKRQEAANVRAEYEAILAAKMDPQAVIPQAKSVPYVGDETSLALVSAKPVDYVDKEFVICGGIVISDYYNWGYEDARSTHYSFEFVRFTKDGELDRQHHPTLYQRRLLGDDLVKVLAARSERNPNMSLLIRCRVTIPSGRVTSFEDFRELFELLDWQLYGDGKWGPWHSQAASGGEDGSSGVRASNRRTRGTQTKQDPAEPR